MIDMENKDLHVAIVLSPICGPIVIIMARFLCRQLLAADCLQLSGLAALWLATKQVHIELGGGRGRHRDVQEEQDPPEAGTLVKLCAGTFTVTNFRHMEVRW